MVDDNPDESQLVARIGDLVSRQLLALAPAAVPPPAKASAPMTQRSMSHTSPRTSPPRWRT